MGGGISDLIRYTNGFKLLFYFYVILFIVFDICSTYFICNMLDVNRILKLYFILSENKKRNYYYYYYYYYYYSLLFLWCCSSFIALFVMLVVVLHSLLFGVISHPSVSYRQDFTPILYFQPSSSQSDLRHLHFNLSGPIFHSFTASATVLSGYFLPTGVFYLTLLPHIFATTCFYQGLSGSRQFFLEVCRLHADPQNTDHAHLFVWFTAIHNLDIQKNSYLNCTKYYHELLVVKSLVYLLLTRFKLF